MSQKINIQVDLEDNEVFSKELVRLLKAKTREVVRNNYVEIIGDEAKKEIERLINTASVRSMVNSVCEDYLKTKIYNMVRAEMDKATNETENIQNIISTSIELRVESMVNHLKSTFVSNAQDDFKKFTRSYFAEKLSQILDPINVNPEEENEENKVGDL